jgi:hypothetical protein
LNLPPQVTVAVGRFANDRDIDVGLQVITHAAAKTGADAYLDIAARRADLRARLVS